MTEEEKREPEAAQAAADSINASNPSYQIDENGNLILKDKTNSHTTGSEVRDSKTTVDKYEDSHSVTNTNGVENGQSRSQGVQKTTKVEQIPFETALQKDPGSYEKQGFVYTPTLKSLLQKRQQREIDLRTQNMEDTERERRKAKYLAWQNALSALGQIGGMGKAPIIAQDNSRTLEAFKKLDQLRAASKDINSDPYISWVDKLVLQQELQHDAREEARYLQQEKMRQEVMKQNAQTMRDKAKANVGSVTTNDQITNSSKQKNESSERTGESYSNSESNLEFSKTFNKDTDKTSYTSEDYMRAMREARGRETGFVIGNNDSTRISADQGSQIYNDVNELFSAVNSGTAKTETIDGKDYYVTDMGAYFLKSDVDTMNGRLSMLYNQILQYNPDSSEGMNAMRNLIQAADRLSNFHYEDIIKQRMESGKRESQGIESGAATSGSGTSSFNIEDYED